MFAASVLLESCSTDHSSEAASWTDRWRLAAHDGSRHMVPTTCRAPSLRLLFFSCSSSSSSAELSFCSSCCLTGETLSHIYCPSVCLPQSINLLPRDGNTPTVQLRVTESTRGREKGLNNHFTRWKETAGVKK